jgi:hypothetical protein
MTSNLPRDGHVLFWITEEDGREFATCAAASFRAAMTERDELRVQNKVLQLRGDTYLEQLKQKHAENERLASDADHYRAVWRKSEAENERLRARLDAAERLIEVVRSREIGTAGGVGAAFEAYDALNRR